MISMPPDGDGIDRRGLLRMTAGLAGAVSMMLCVTAGGMLTGCGPQTVKADEQEALLKALADTVLPATATPSAGSRGNVAFMMRALEAGLLGVEGDALARLAPLLDDRAGRPFPDLSSQQRGRVLAEVDREVFAGPVPARHPWFPVKALILMAYYTSEAGMTQDLRYALVPGDYQGDVPVDAHWRAASSDWSAVTVKKALHP